MDIRIDPLKNKMFSGDVLNVQENGEMEIFESPNRYREHVGILQLDSNKTYGRTENKKKLLYKCVPYNKELPDFLIPYEIKVGFQKSLLNKYVLFKIQNWNDKHPRVELTEILGDVDDFNAFCEYQIHCKDLNHSIKDVTSYSKNWLKTNSLKKCIDVFLKESRYNVVDRRSDRTFTIDPKGSMDLDDGFSVSSLENGKKRISVHIANVAIILELMELWKLLGDKVSTIYLPDRIRPMLPKVLSEDMCSLLEKKDRLAFTMDVYVDSDGKIIEDETTFSNSIIHISKNYCYEDAGLPSSSDYLYLKNVSKTNDSHEMVEFWMKYMNTTCAMKLAISGIGVFRSVKFIDKTRLIDDFKSDYIEIINQWNNVKSEYKLFSESVEHEIMERSHYVHITSPIRRLVDVMNQVLFIRKVMNVELSSEASLFMEKRILKISFINKSMKSIKKVQDDCKILHNVKTDPRILNREYEGIILDKIETDDAFKYTVFLKELNFVSCFKCKLDIEIYSIKWVRLFLFENEHLTKKKIRAQLCF
jgi:exoribonuclease R